MDKNKHNYIKIKLDKKLVYTLILAAAAWGVISGLCDVFIGAPITSFIKQALS